MAHHIKGPAVTLFQFLFDCSVWMLLGTFLWYIFGDIVRRDAAG